MSKSYNYVEIYIEPEGGSIYVHVSGGVDPLSFVQTAFANCPDEIIVQPGKVVVHVREITIISTNPDDYSSRVLKGAILLALKDFEIVPSSIFVDVTSKLERFILCKVEQ